MVIKDELSKVIDIFKNNNIDNYIFEAHLIFRHFLKMSPMDLVLEGNSELEKKHYDEISEAVKRRCENEPLQYILNSQEFMGLDFYVDKNVQTPKPLLSISWNILRAKHLPDLMWDAARVVLR